MNQNQVKQIERILKILENLESQDIEILIAFGEGIVLERRLTRGRNQDES